MDAKWDGDKDEFLEGSIMIKLVTTNHMLSFLFEPHFSISEEGLKSFLENKDNFS